MPPVLTGNDAPKSGWRETATMPPHFSVLQAFPNFIK